eukprot:scaffold20916_cov84-Skeletonema_marinoi.AAC.1
MMQPRRCQLLLMTLLQRVCRRGRCTSYLAVGHNITLVSLRSSKCSMYVAASKQQAAKECFTFEKPHFQI